MAAQHGAVSLRQAAVAWLLAGLIWFALETVSAAAFPAYSYAHNYISDLGIPPTRDMQGQVVGSPRHAAMNVNFIAQGVLFLIGGICLFRANSAAGRARALFLGLAAVNGVGNALVGTFHSSPQAHADGTARFHLLGAAMAILAGNAAIIVCGLNARRLGVAKNYGSVSACIGVLGLLCVIALQAGDPFDVPGVWERGSVYSIIIWEFVTGIVILVPAFRQALMPGGGTGQPASRAID